jgi:hypothetical protein
MSSVATNDKRILEKLFQMGNGYVLNFTDRSFGEFFKDDVGINIYDGKYDYASGSKANRMRGFWQVASDKLVGGAIQKLISYINTQIFLGNLNRQDFPDELIRRGQNIIFNLLGSTEDVVPLPTENEFLAMEFGHVSIDKLGFDAPMNRILEQRIDEIRKCLRAKAALGAIFLCGSTLEGILFGVACANAKDFNQSAASPKDKTGKVKQLPDWTLNEFINVARDLSLVGEDVKKFSHGLREFRNYIHPYQQMSSNFNPDEQTAKICWQVLQAAIIQLSN